ncbi:MAG: hypothetical protein ACREA5_07005 [Nitrosotalea sp.]
MKAVHLTKLTLAGLSCLIIGIIISVTSLYLYEIDLQFDKKEREITTMPGYMGPIRVSPYANVQPCLTTIGIILISMGAFLLSYKQVKNGISKK